MWKKRTQERKKCYYIKKTEKKKKREKGKKGEKKREKGKQKKGKEQKKKKQEGKKKRDQNKEKKIIGPTGQPKTVGKPTISSETARFLNLNVFLSKINSKLIIYLNNKE